MTGSMSSTGQLACKVAVVTGAASGFGLAIAKVFANEGARVVAVDLNAEALTKAFDDATKDAVLPVVADVSSRHAWEQILDAAMNKFGGVDILVNNAGICYNKKPSVAVTESEFDRVINVNLKSIYLSVQTIVPHMQERGGGSIVNIASIGATRPRPGLVWYNASKAAVANATKGLAAEFGADQIRVNAVCPLLSATGLFETCVGVPSTEENMKKFLFNVPLGRLCSGEDVANACLYLSGPLGNFITGVTLDVDGGRSVGS